MGKKPHKKSATPMKETTKKLLSAQKRHELNLLVENLLKLCFKQTNNINEQWAEYLEIQSILERIQAIESPLKMKNPTGGNSNRSGNIDVFINWAQENGAKFNNIRINEFPGYELGLEAMKSFKKDELLLMIPKKIIMSEETVAIASLGSTLGSEMKMFDTMANVKLAYGLLLEKLNPKSCWKPYLDILPEKYSTVMYFNVNEMQELKGSNLFGQALNQCKNIARQYAFISRCIQKNVPAAAAAAMNKNGTTEGSEIFEILKERFTYDLYRWAVSTVMTRQNEIPKTASLNGDILENGKEQNNAMPALIPLWDMANHKQGVVTSAYNMEAERLESTALMDFEKGDQIFIYYGDRSNGDLLLHNGFIYPENTKDSVAIKLGLSNSDELLTERMKLLQQLNIPKNCELKVLPAPEFISPELLGFIRIFNMNQDQLNHWINSERAFDLMHIDCALETSLESKTWKFLETRFSLLLRVFPTSLDEDKTLLESHNKGQKKLNQIKLMLIKYRILEKKILLQALDYAKQRTKV